MLLERERELAAVEPLLRAAPRGSGGTVYFEGVAGIGKSALLDQILGMAAEYGLGTLTARARETESNLPHGVSQQLLAPAVEELSEGDVDNVFSGAAVLARPLFQRGDPVEEISMADQGFARLHGLYWLCANLAERKPLLLTIDDAHLADPASLRFLTYLARRVEQLPVAIVIGARTGESSTMRGPLADLRELTEVRVMRLQPLSEKSCRTIAERTTNTELDEEICARFYSVTEGNPFLMNEVIPRLAAGGPAAAESLLESGSSSEPLGLSIGRARLAEATDTQLKLARAAAILGRDADLSLSARLAGIDRSEVQEAGNDLLEAGVIRSLEPIDFVHPLVRSAVLDGLTEADLDALNRRAAELLHSHGATPEKIAGYLLGCRAVGEEWASETLRLAANRAQRMGASDSEGRYLERLLTERLEPDVRADALVRFAQVQALDGAGRAFEALEGALDLVAEPRRRLAILGTITRILIAQGRFEKAAETAMRGIEEVPEEDKALALRAAVEWASIARFVPQRRADALRTLQQVISSGEPVEDDIAVHLHTEIALSHIRNGDSRKAAVAALNEALPDPSDPHPQVYSTSSLPVLLHCLAWVDDYKGAEQLMDAALREARRQGSITLFATAGCYGALGVFHQGRVAESASLAQQAIDAIPEGWGLALPLACTIASYGYMERGELGDAQRVLEIASADERWEESPQFPFLVEARGRLAMMWGNHEAAIGHLNRAGELLGTLIGTANPAVLAWRSRLARALAAVGRIPEALELAEEEVDLAHRFGAARALAAARRVLGELRGAEGIEEIEAALELASGTDARLEQVNCQITLGRALRSAGDEKRARRVLQDALIGAVRCGSLLMENVARSELDAAGARPRRRAVTGAAALTPGERRVADLAAEGYSNREIAESLFVTIKAVEWHLSNAYRKLDIASRDQLRDALEVDISSDDE